MYISAEGAAAQAQRLEVIANNMANVDTAGFKQDVPMFQARFAEAIQKGQAQPGDRSINDLGGGVKIIDVRPTSSGSSRHRQRATWP
jgi:flagellar basal-body rod protein FlgF/flagellar basal-body rod protein FlgG